MSLVALDGCVVVSERADPREIHVFTVNVKCFFKVFSLNLTFSEKNSSVVENRSASFEKNNEIRRKPVAVEEVDRIQTGLLPNFKKGI